MRVNETFASLQGEGVDVGEPTVFVRFQGCNLCCTWCDTYYAQDANGGVEMSVADILGDVGALAKGSGLLANYYNPISHVCITGGEPLYQDNIALRALVGGLQQRSFRVEIETNGAYHAPGWAAEVDSWCVDIKGPSSGLVGYSYESWFGSRAVDQIKFVVEDERDLEYAATLIARHADTLCKVLVSPVLPHNVGRWPLHIDNSWLQRVAAFCVDYGVRYSLQLHKVIWDPERRGV